MGVPGIQTNRTLLKIVNSLKPNVKNTRPEVLVWKKNTWDVTGAQLKMSKALPQWYLCSKSLTLLTVWNLGSLCWWAIGVTESDLKEESQWQIFTISAKMVALLTLSKTQIERKLILPFGIEISYVMNKILEIKMQWNLTDILVQARSMSGENCVHLRTKF